MIKKSFFWSKKNILITGACGSIGTELTSELIKINTGKIILFDNNENGIYKLLEKHKKNKNIVPVLGDVRNYNSLLESLKNIQIVFHGAALKHVNVGELCPNEIIETNINGVKNLIKSSIETNVSKVLFMSSDKAINPTNVMGASKLLGEKLINAANQRHIATKFFTTRFGNVLGSSGSALGKFLKQIKKGEAVTLTDFKMTRFIMTHKEAIELLLIACEKAKGKEIFVSKMRAIKIHSLILALFSIFKKKIRSKVNENIKIIGATKGEKFYEELMNNEEVEKAVSKKKFFVINDESPNKNDVLKIYNSKNEKLLEIKEIITILEKDQKFIELALSE
jgi:FlaA1/EpsC-like NDP-sugar epimerase